MESGSRSYFARLTRNEWKGKEATEKKGKEEEGNKKKDKGRDRQKDETGRKRDKTHSITAQSLTTSPPATPLRLGSTSTSSAC